MNKVRLNAIALGVSTTNTLTEFSTLWTHTFRMPGLRSGTPLKKYKIKKSFSLEYLRSAYRKVFPAESSSLTKLAMQAEPSYAYDPGFFNGCYFVLSSKLNTDDHIADVTQALPAAGGGDSQGSVAFPQIRDQMGTGITDPTGFQQLPRGAAFAYSGMLYVEHRVQSIRRHLPLTTFMAINPLEERIAALEAGQTGQQTHLDNLEEEQDKGQDTHDEHVHDVKTHKGKLETSTPLIN